MPLQATSGAASYDAFGGGIAAPIVPNYIEEVFSTYLYTGTGSALTITNGINLAGEGGIVWIKARSGATNNQIWDSAQGKSGSYYWRLCSNNNEARFNNNGGITTLNSDGFSLGGSGLDWNTNSVLHTSWTFRKQPKFFDVVTYTGTGANRTIAHSLGSIPGCIMVKRTDTLGDWQVYHSSLANTQYLVLNTTAAAATGATRWNSTTPTASEFSLGTVTTVNASGGTYVAYIFAHDAGGFGLTGTNNVISCGSFTTDASGLFSVNLGYEPQWVMVKRTSGVSDWTVFDTMRGMPTAAASLVFSPTLLANTSVIEDAAGGTIGVNATGFNSLNGYLASSSTFIYIAIRRGQMAVPTSGASVFAPIAYTGTNADNRLVDTGIVTDMTMARIRAAVSTGSFYTADRLRANASLGTAITAVEDTDADSFMTPTVGYGNSFSAMNGFGVGNDVTRQLNQSSTTQLAYAFKRAPSFFDEVCYTGTGGFNAITHNLGITPELIIVKNRNAVKNWIVWETSISATAYDGLILNSTAAKAQEVPIDLVTSTQFGTYPSATGSFLNNGTSISGNTYVAYLFATCAGVSKVGSYTGTAATQTINCSFTAGARFVLIKSTSATGNWYVWDSARGIVAGNDPYLLLNTTAAEVTTTDWVDTAATGFQLSSAAGNLANSSGVSYIFLAIA
jgi:hypothetical protein